VIKDESPSDIVDWLKMSEKDEGELIGIFRVKKNTLSVPENISVRSLIASLSSG
jgi:hypothetical protein